MKKLAVCCITLLKYYLKFYDDYDIIKANWRWWNDYYKTYI